MGAGELAQKNAAYLAPPKLIQKGFYMKVYINANLDYLIGHLRYGHKEGEIDIPDEDFEEFQKDPIDYLENYDLVCELPIVIDDYSIDDWGHITDLEYEIVGQK